MTQGVTSDSYRELSDSGVQTHNSRMIALLRANGGKVPGVPDSEMPVLILTTTGGRSGESRTTPLGYLEHDGRRYIAGSNGGKETPPAWTFNVRTHPGVVAEVAGETYNAVMRKLDTAERDKIFATLTAKHPFFGDYQARIQRTIPIYELLRTAP